MNRTIHISSDQVSGDPEGDHDGDVGDDDD
jgi:hypothetical protein